MIDSIILAHDRRGMTRMRAHLAATAVQDAAAFLAAHGGQALILTGFYAAGTAETDGPPGALALAEALIALGGSCAIVTDRHGAPPLRGALAHEQGPLTAVQVEDFPILDQAASSRAAAVLLARFRPSVVVAIERCGVTARGAYLNMRGVDITAHTARLDPLVQSVPSIAIGDGGNEIGMGRIAGALHAELGIAEPCITEADHLVLGAVSNWGAYGLIAALSLQVGRNLLPAPAMQRRRLERLVAMGAVDGVTGAREATVDGFPSAIEDEVLTTLHAACT